MQGITFSSPPVLSRALAESCGSRVWSIAHGDDVVSRFSVNALEALRLELANTNWKVLCCTHVMPVRRHLFAR